ncbi:hypothetical protein NEF87_002349 [Candidatus Lokiarchaeum ossiferum]|uniref:Calcineurin-like phosphoesterase domain-containing protein n=1 Tax=Candidatus Lokiarchaeum ossiferum TaxID=2951803 RepID=A0ABY6HUD5_9ARCH|nr:hypothetical protein NEF87_002349 [Candidatus Lokiarchaeum sp. B-35]
MSNSDQILIVSDFHLADGSKLDDFSLKSNSLERENRLIAFMEKYSPQNIYINGDIYELWQVKMAEIINAHPTIIKFMDYDSRVIKICGNHDYTLGGAFKVSLTTNNGKKICITHGFKNEKHLKNKIGRFFCWIIGKIELIFPNIDNFFAHKYYLNKGTRQKVMDYGKNLLDKGYDIVVCAHSHYLTKEEFGSKIYTNSGTCQEGKLEGVLIDLNSCEVSLVSETE